MISAEQYEKLLAPSGNARAFLYVCDDGTQEVMPPSGGEFELLTCEDPTIYPLAGGRVTGRKMSTAHVA